jgi:hypothetical protein
MSNPHIKTVVQCGAPNCKNVRAEANHWFIVIDDVQPSGMMFGVWPFTMEILESVASAVPVCGEECLAKMVSRVLGVRKVWDAEAQAAK